MFCVRLPNPLYPTNYSNNRTILAVCGIALLMWHFFRRIVIMPFFQQNYPFPAWSDTASSSSSSPHEVFRRDVEQQQYASSGLGSQGLSADWLLGESSQLNAKSRHQQQQQQQQFIHPVSAASHKLHLASSAAGAIHPANCLCPPGKKERHENGRERQQTQKRSIEKTHCFINDSSFPLFFFSVVLCVLYMDNARVSAEKWTSEKSMRNCSEDNWQRHIRGNRDWSYKE